MGSCKIYRRIKRREYIKRNPEKQNARYLVAKNVRLGILIKPTNCSKCKDISKIEAHHNDYSKPIEVIWVCKKCHISLDKASKNE
jgi:ribosomal protein S27AE